ncbi:hypothetical protein O6P43_010183 [Quillaja saponaria]|uniref:Uncharacterized protein n=1 Tax=Quillaja saponaria TaxID=32244 RepID=A0AAD7PZW0_QUISA|nr:hypothetical protein O6P43_010183 [Quillaja saponaria]
MIPKCEGTYEYEFHYKTTKGTNADLRALCCKMETVINSQYYYFLFFLWFFSSLTFFVDSNIFLQTRLLVMGNLSSPYISWAIFPILTQCLDQTSPFPICIFS